MALTKVADSTWGVTLNKARQVYTAVVRPAMTYGATTWHAPEGTRKKGLGPATKLTVLENRCLRSITGAYRAANIKVLEAEAGAIPLDICLDQTVLRSKDTQRCQEGISLAKKRIRLKLRNKRGRKNQPRDTPLSIKSTWAKNVIKTARSNSAEEIQQK